MPIATDARLLIGGTGVSTYARGLAGALPQITTQPLLVEARATASPILRWLEAVRPGARRLVYDQHGRAIVGRDVFRYAHLHFSTWGRLYRLTTDLPAGIVHWSYPVPMRVEGWINLYTVHDAIPIEHPDLTPIRARRHRAVHARLLGAGARLVTVSESARASIIEALGCEPTRVVNAGQAVDCRSEKMAPIPPPLQRYGYFIVVGTIEPRKNIVALLAAYRRSGTRLPLVLVGPDGWQAGPILQAIADTPGAIRLPYQTRAQVLGLIEAARALLFPSLAEGFGLPLAEAMALGTAVMTSNRGALAEIAGGAAALVDPGDEAQMAETIARLARDDALVAALAASGTMRATAFTGAIFVHRLRDIYVDALRGTVPLRKARNS